SASTSIWTAPASIASRRGSAAGSGCSPTRSTCVTSGQTRDTRVPWAGQARDDRRHDRRGAAPHTEPIQEEAMSSTDARTDPASGATSAGSVDTKLEVVV